MTDAATLLAEFVDQLNAGGAPEAGDFLQRAEDDEQRNELADGIDAVLMLAPEPLRHPRASDGSFALGLDADRIAAIAQVTWPEAMPAWMREAAMTTDELARAALASGAIEATEENVSAAKRWIESIQSGAESVRSISAKARGALADALKVGREAFDAAGDFDPQAAIAFRVEDSDDALAASRALIEVSAMIEDALPGAAPSSEVDRFFAA